MTELTLSREQILEKRRQQQARSIAKQQKAKRRTAAMEALRILSQRKLANAA